MTDSVQTESGSRAFRWRLFALCLTLLSPPAEAGWFRALEPHHITREPGPPTSVRLPFDVLDPSLPFRVRIFNGGASGTGEPIASAVVRLNGQRIFGPVAFQRAGRGTLDKAVALRSSNLLAIRIFGRRGTMTVLVLGRDDGAPVIEARVTPPANAAGWHNADDVAAGGVTVEFDCSDAESGIDSCSDPVVLDTEGATQVVTGTAIDLAGNVATASAVVNLDVKAPMIDVLEPSAGATTGVEVPTEGSVVDDRSGVAFAHVDGKPLSLSANGDFAQTVSVPAGFHTLMYTAEDIAGNRADAQVDIDAAISSGVEVEFLSPGPDSIQYNSGWPLTLRVTLPEGRDHFLGIGVAPRHFSKYDDLRAGPFPRRGQTGFFILSDLNHCPSYIAGMDLPNGCAGSTTVYNGGPLDCGTGGEEQDETLVRITPGLSPNSDGSRELFPALVLLSDTGNGLVERDDGSIEFKNLAYWNSVAYELKDSRRRTSITAHMNVPFGRFAPRVRYEVTDLDANCTDELCTGLGHFTAVGREVSCSDGSAPPCDVEYDFTCDDDDEITEGRMKDIYIPAFEGKEVTLRAFLVQLTASEGAPDTIREETGGSCQMRNEKGDCLTLLSSPVEIKVSQRFGAQCIHQDRPGTGLSLPECGGPCDSLMQWLETSDVPGGFCDDDQIPDSSPVGAEDPPR